MTDRTDGRKQHWASLPENAAKVKAAIKKRAKTRAKNAKRKSDEIPPKPPTRKFPTSRELLVELARIGAQQQLQELEQRIIVLKMFLKRV